MQEDVFCLQKADFSILNLENCLKMISLTEIQIENLRKKVIKFLRQYDIYYKDIDIQKYVNLFLDEMKRGF